MDAAAPAPTRRNLTHGPLPEVLAMAYLKARTAPTAATPTWCAGPTPPAASANGPTEARPPPVGRLRERVAQEARDEVPDVAASRESDSRPSRSLARRPPGDESSSEPPRDTRSCCALASFPPSGRGKIGSITSREIEEWLGSLADSGLATKTVHNVLHTAGRDLQVRQAPQHDPVQPVFRRRPAGTDQTKPSSRDSR